MLRRPSKASKPAKKPSGRAKSAKAARPAPISAKPTQAPKAADAHATFAKGDRVMHPMFGKGLVKDIDGDKLTIDFAKGQKVILESFVSRVR